MKKLIFNCFIGWLISVNIIWADTPFSEEQKQAMHTIIHDYLVSQPEVLVEASQALQAKQQKMMQTEVQQLVAKHAQDVFNDTYTVVGNPQGSVTLVEFFDYQCIHCKKMLTIIEAVIKQDPHLRVVFKEFPIFGESSAYASRAALAAAIQHQYLKMHQALLNIDNKLTPEAVMKVAKDLSLNIEKLKQDMKSKAVKAALDRNRVLAENLHLMGTPAFIIASTPNGQYQSQVKKPIVFIPGATTQEALLSLIKEAAG